MIFQKIADALILRIGKDAKEYDRNLIQDKEIKRKLQMLAMIGTSALPQDKLTRY